LPPGFIPVWIRGPKDLRLRVPSGITIGQAHPPAQIGSSAEPTIILIERTFRRQEPWIDPSPFGGKKDQSSVGPIAPNRPSQKIEGLVPFWVLVQFTFRALRTRSHHPELGPIGLEPFDQLLEPVGFDHHTWFHNGH